MTRELSLDSALQRYTAQNTLFGLNPARADMLELDLPKADATRVPINVWRNHNFETLSSLIEPYSLFGRWWASWRLGAYDDSFSFEGWQPAAAELIWLDSDRGASASWLEQRLQTLRARSLAPIVLTTWHGDAAALHVMCERIPEVYFLDLRELCRGQGVELLNERMAALSGSPVSKAAQLVIARELACRALPAVLFPPVKAVAVDLDETLHGGVLAEDGITGVQLTEAHRALQQQLRELRERGIYVCLVSRNELRDVERLFEARTDYPLRIQDFSAVEVAWQEKSIALRRIAERLRIGVDALLFVDDNAGELAAAVAELPALHTLHAQPQAELTQRALSYYPGLWRFRAGGADKLRVADMHANIAREVLATRLGDPEEYFRSLQIKLCFRANPLDQLDRLAELSLKTNQFNLALKRWGAATLREYLALPDTSIVSVHLQDRLSDSGVIALLCADRQDQLLRVQELCISCRALGRRLEQSIVTLALRSMPNFQGCTHVTFEEAVGPRNQPAREWLATLLGGNAALPAQRVSDFEAPSGIAWSKES
jgi:FkbH-like protein